MSIESNTLHTALEAAISAIDEREQPLILRDIVEAIREYVEAIRDNDWNPDNGPIYEHIANELPLVSLYKIVQAEKFRQQKEFSQQ